ncbi:MAG: hypothetical protein ACI4ST_03535, partial [Candidatus Gallimonas sp.]
MEREKVLTDPKKQFGKARFYKILSKGLMWLVGAILLLISVFPFLWVIISSFKPLAEIESIRFQFFPKVWTVENYAELFRSNSVYFPRGASFLQSIGMTLLVSFVSLALSLVVNSLAAFAFARLEFPGKKFLWIVYAVNMFIPNIAILIPC